jgi:hypothetical protein
MWSRPRWLQESRPSVLPGPLPAGAFGVDKELAVDGVADMTLERPEGFLLGLALGDFAVEVGAALGVGLADLADGGHVDGVVQATVASLGEAVHNSPTGGQLDGGGAVVGRILPGRPSSPQARRPSDRRKLTLHHTGHEMRLEDAASPDRTTLARGRLSSARATQQ